MLKFLWLISAPKDTIKTLSRYVWMFLTKIDTPYPIVDWPCQDFKQGSTREQPSAGISFLLLLLIVSAPQAPLPGQLLGHPRRGGLYKSARDSVCLSS